MIDREDRIEARLRETLHPSQMQLINESHLHVGHAGAATGLGHFRLIIESERFANRSMLECHRIVYDALGELMQTDIHALTLQTRAPRPSP